jgi:hypothetical protein
MRQEPPNAALELPRFVTRSPGGVLGAAQGDTW